MRISTYVGPKKHFSVSSVYSVVVLFFPATRWQIKRAFSDRFLHRD